MSAPHLQPFRDALDPFLKQMHINLDDNPFAEEVEDCASPGAVLRLLERNMNAFKVYRDGDRRLINRLRPIITIIYPFSAILGDTTILVNHKQSTFSLWNFFFDFFSLPDPVPTCDIGIPWHRFAPQCASFHFFASPNHFHFQSY